MIFRVGVNPSVPLICATLLAPIGRPLTFGEYAWSQDGDKLMVMTNTHRELNRKTAGEYWALDRAGCHPATHRISVPKLLNVE